MAYGRFSLRCVTAFVTIVFISFLPLLAFIATSTNISKNILNVTDFVDTNEAIIVDPVCRPCVGKQIADDHQFKEVFPDVFIYSAFIDERINTFEAREGNGTHTIRMMAILPDLRNKTKQTIYCVGFLATGKYWSVQLTYYMLHDGHQLMYNPYILSCRLPREFWQNPPCSVHLSSSTVPNKNSLWIKVYSSCPTLQHKLEVCVPPVYGKVSGLDVIEFIELVRLFGAERIHFYNYNASSSVLKVLSHYKQLGVVSVQPWNLNNRVQQKGIHYNGQMLNIQDCLYRHMFSAHFLAFLDIDEMFVPRKHSDWVSMMNYVKKNCSQHVGIKVCCAFFDPRWQPEIIQKLNVRRDVFVVRQQDLNCKRSKVIVDPRQIFEMGIHRTHKMISAKLKLLTAQEDLVLLHHYRRCPCPLTSDRQTDYTLFPYVFRLETKIMRVRVALGL